MPETINIGVQKIGFQQPCFIIAEAGVNHNGDMHLARQLVDSAVEAGADAVKFQTFRAELLVHPDTPKASYQIRNSGGEQTQLEMLQKLELSYAHFEELQRYCSSRNILFLSTPFEQRSLDFLDQLGVPVFKIGSGEITNRPFLVKIGRKKRPVILSTGMSNLREVAEAVAVLRSAGCEELILLHCVSNYPAEPAHVNLRAMQTLGEHFKVPVGFSDHTLGIEIALAAVALGACVIEKHFTVGRTLPGPDQAASLEPHELKALVEGIRKVESALGHGRKEPVGPELEIAAVARKSLIAAVTIPAGTIITESMISILRPGTGLPPSMIDHFIGKIAKMEIKTGALLTMEMIQ